MTAEDLRFEATGRAGALFLRALGSTLRVRIKGDGPLKELRRQGKPVIFCFWHSRILPLAYLHRSEGIVVLVSEHGDGEYITRVIERLGFGTARGSSTRGGARGLRGLVRAAREGRDLGFTPDGPRGPARKLKLGVLVTAQLTGAPILPLAAGAARPWRMSSWDRLIVPKPFSELRLEYAEPYYIPRRATEEELSRYALDIETILDRITDSVDGVEGQA